MSSAFGWVIWIPLVGACALFVLSRRGTRAIVSISAGGTILAAVWLCWRVISMGPQQHLVGGWPPPLGIRLYADGLTVVMLLVTAVIGLAVTVYALGYFTTPSPRAPWSPADGFWPLWFFLWAGLNALFLSGDVFNLYVTLEILSLAAVALVIIAGEPAALVAAMRYLLVAFLGSLMYLLGVALLYAALDTVDMALIMERATPSPVVFGALALMTVGLAVKAALFPLHFWLPPAHASAPAPVSAVLSALVVKASFYLVLRLWLETFPATVTVSAAQFLGVLGAGAIIWGSIQALRQERLKLLIAHSTVAQVGYLFLAIPLALPAVQTSVGQVGLNAEAFHGGVMQILAHASAKAAMFLAAGNLMRAAGHDRIRDLGSAMAALRPSGYAFGLAGISLMGLPPSGGFTAKWLLLSAAINSGQWWWAIVVILGGLLAAGYVVLVLRQMLVPATMLVSPNPVSRTLELPALTLALLSLLLGFGATEVANILSMGAPAGLMNVPVRIP